MRIFINHVNTYSGVALARTLRHTDNVLNRLFGTARGLEEGVEASPVNEHDEKQAPVPSFIRRLISKRNPQQLLQNLLTCSLAVFDLHNTDPDELEFILKKLKGAPLRQPLCVVLISSTITWGNTRRQYVRDPPDKSENGETAAESGDNNLGDERRQTSSPFRSEDPKSPRSSDSSGLRLPKPGETSGSNPTATELKPKIFNGENFELRVPPKTYERWKMVETLLISLNSKENFRGIVVSAGLMYGFGEDTLYEPFKAAWLGLKTHKLVGVS